MFGWLARGFAAKTAAMLVLILLSIPASAQQDFTFTTPDGDAVTLSSLRGRVVVMLFAGIQDPQCRDEFKALSSLADRYRGKNVSILWVSIDSVNEAPNDRLKNPCGPAGSVTILRDQNRAAFRRFSGRIAQLPTIVVLSQQGDAQGQPRGGFNPNADFVNDIAAIVDRLLR